MTYRHVIYANSPAPHLMALFSEDIGGLYVRLLDELGIAIVWHTPDRWIGSKSARAPALAELCERTDTGAAPPG